MILTTGRAPAHPSAEPAQKPKSKLRNTTTPEASMLIAERPAVPAPANAPAWKERAESWDALRPEVGESANIEVRSN